MREDRRQQLLILVHPGSACGSADFNLGSQEAEVAREGICRTLSSWEGPILVVDGALSDELPLWVSLDTAIGDALRRNAAAGHRTVRIVACDETAEDWPSMIHPTLDSLQLPKDVHASITGAWFFEDDTGGCVNAVRDMVAFKGITTTVLDSAIKDPFALVDSEDQDPNVSRFLKL